MNPFRYLMPTEVVLAPGCVAEVGKHAAPLGRAPLVVTGKHSARASGALDKALAQLPGATVFDGVEENPDTGVCARGAAFCRERRCDLVVGLGGGSALDAAKAIAVLAANEGNRGFHFGVEKFTKALPVIAIPTTAGTGSEATPYAVLVDAATGYKRTISGKGIFPVVALLDPELSVTMPRAVTVATGLDALSQALEGAVSKRATPLGDLFAHEICRIVKGWLPKAAGEPDNIEARTRMLYAAMLSGCVISQSGTTLVHGMGYYYTLEFGIAHGLANALLLPPVMEYNARHLPEKIDALAMELGAPASGDPGARMSAALYGLMAELGVSSVARDAGVSPDRLDYFAEDISSDRSRFKNQVGDPSREEVVAFFRKSFEGPA